MSVSSDLQLHLYNYKTSINNGMSKEPDIGLSKTDEVWENAARAHVSPSGFAYFNNLSTIFKSEF